jgi:hypothetical protein
MMVRRGKRLARGWQVAIGVAALAYAALAVGSGWDRASLDRPDVATTVPGIFANVAHATLAHDAVLRQDGAMALAQGRAAVARAPMEAGSSAMLGGGAQLLNQRDLADRAYLVSDEMGWHQSMTQVYMIQRDMARGDFDKAAGRMDAMLRLQPDRHRNAVVIGLVEGNLYAQPAWVRRLAMRPPWLDAYASDVQGMAPEQLGMRALMLADMADAGVRLGCGGIDAIAHQLVLRSAYDDAHTLWAGHCATVPGDAVWDGHLAQLSVGGSGKFSDFRWQMVPSGDLSVAMHGEGRGDGQWMEIQNNGMFPLPFLRQLMVPEPGRYRLRWVAREADGKPSSHISVKLSCGEMQPPVVQGGAMQADVVVTEACQGVWMQFEVDPQAQPLIFGDISFVREKD